MNILAAAIAVIWRFFDPGISHSAVTPELDRMVGVALEQWGETSAITDDGPGLDIFVTGGDSSEAFPDICYHHDPACADNPGEIRGCTIEFVLEWIAVADPALAQNYVTHEVGHCLGLDHNERMDSIMNGNNIGGGFGAYDREIIAALYPRRESAEEPFRLFMPGVSRAP